MNTTQMTNFQTILSNLPQFVLDNNPNCEMAYDWVCDQLGCSFASDTDMFNQFYDIWFDNVDFN